MKIGLYFGSFNPIHTGHCIIASHIVQNTALEQLWLIISPQNPFKKSSTLLNEYDRLNLVRLAIDGERAFRASDIEFHLPRPSYTCDTLIHLGEKYPQHQFSVILGSDSLQNLANWKNAASVIREYPLYVYPRPGFPATNELGANLTEVKAPLLQISSTHIRETIRRGQSVRYLVPDAVASELEKNGYYK